MSNNLISIVVLSWNRLHYTKQTIENLIKITKVPHELILVDNNSAEPGLKEYLLQVKGNQHTVAIKHVFNEDNFGVAGGRNEGLRVADPSSKYLMTLDDDVILPNNYDVDLISVCDNIPTVGVTGVNVEPARYPVQVINGVACRPKNGNLGGACLCFPRRVFDRIGYYECFGQYGHEDAFTFYKLQHLGLLSVYIEQKGIHLDTDADKKYRLQKNKAHEKGSFELNGLSAAIQKMRATNNVYTPYIKYNPNKQKELGSFTNDLILSDRK